MEIRYALEKDLDYLLANDHHVRASVVRAKVECAEIIVLTKDDNPIGWLRYGYFWDVFPFMNMLFLEEEYRGQGWGSRLIQFWEQEMIAQGHDTVMTSSLSNERAQHLYRRLGYHDCGGMRWPEDTALEIIFLKKLRTED